MFDSKWTTEMKQQSNCDYFPIFNEYTLFKMDKNLKLEKHYSRKI